jgi:SOS-response transcriptional repressor LexA
VLRLAHDLADHGLAGGDLLIVTPRPNGDAQTGELVIATVDSRAFLGRWWKKRRTRALRDADLKTITNAAKLQVLGAVTVVLRCDG